MGRGGYNGGGPVVKNPKKDDVYVREWSSGARETLALPKKFEIVKAGEGLQNERGGQQVEFGYLVSAAKVTGAKKAETSPSKPKLFFCKRNEAKKNKAEYRWAAASVLLKYFPLEVRNFHQQNPDAPRPFGLEIYEAATD